MACSYLKTGLDPTAVYGAEVMSFPDPLNRGCLCGPLAQMFGGQKRLGGQLVRMKQYLVAARGFYDCQDKVEI